MSALVHCPAHDLHYLWETIKPGLAECIRQDPQAPWLEDIYATLKIGGALLYVLRDDEAKYKGFCVLQNTHNPWNGAKGLHIWYAHGKTVFEEGFSHIESLAHEHGITSITFSSNRDAFERLMKPLGFQVRQVEYVKRIT